MTNLETCLNNIQKSIKNCKQIATQTETTQKVFSSLSALELFLQSFQSTENEKKAFSEEFQKLNDILEKISKDVEQTFLSYMPNLNNMFWGQKDQNNDPFETKFAKNIEQISTIFTYEKLLATFPQVINQFLQVFECSGNEFLLKSLLKYRLQYKNQQIRNYYLFQEQNFLTCKNIPAQQNENNKQSSFILTEDILWEALFQVRNKQKSVFWVEFRENFYTFLEKSKVIYNKALIEKLKNVIDPQRQNKVTISQFFEFYELNNYFQDLNCLFNLEKMLQNNNNNNKNQKEQNMAFEIIQNSNQQQNMNQGDILEIQNSFSHTIVGRGKSPGYQKALFTKDCTTVSKEQFFIHKIENQYFVQNLSFSQPTQIILQNEIESHQQQQKNNHHKKRKNSHDIEHKQNIKIIYKLQKNMIFDINGLTFSIQDCVHVGKNNLKNEKSYNDEQNYKIIELDMTEKGEVIEKFLEKQNDLIQISEENQQLLDHYKKQSQQKQTEKIIIDYNKNQYEFDHTSKVLKIGGNKSQNMLLIGNDDKLFVYKYCEIFYDKNEQIWCLKVLIENSTTNNNDFSNNNESKEDKQQQQKSQNSQKDDNNSNIQIKVLMKTSTQNQQNSKMENSRLISQQSNIATSMVKSNNNNLQLQQQQSSGINSSLEYPLFAIYENMVLQFGEFKIKANLHPKKH